MTMWGPLFESAYEFQDSDRALNVSTRPSKQGRCEAGHTPRTLALDYFYVEHSLINGDFNGKKYFISCV